MILPENFVEIGEFAVCPTVVSQSEYESVLGKNPSEYKVGATGENPVESVSWFDAVSFCNLLSLKMGLSPCYSVGGKENPELWGERPWSVEFEPKKDGIRLLTDGEWREMLEFCRRGKDFDGAKFLYRDTVASKRPGSVAAGKPMSGIYGIIGNVWEWTFGPEDEQRIFGGSFLSTWEELFTERTAKRGTRNPEIGFRVCRTLLERHERCPECGNEVSSLDTFCVHCGILLRKEPCKSCGEKIPLGSKFCWSCGKAQ